ncbi:MAG: hypothetical protein KDA87_10560, partial [Planctomycetales bacterium]|nr:hypothetical protein [Planctomycetales bacterium]
IVDVIVIDPDPDPDTGKFPDADSDLGEDPHGSTLDSGASQLPFLDFWPEAGQLSSFIDEFGDVDVFQFRTDQPSWLQMEVFTPDGGFEPLIQVYSATGELLGEGPMLVDAMLDEAGTYYVSIQAFESGTGQYVARYFVSPHMVIDPIDPDPNDPFNPPVDAELGNDIHVDQIGEDATPIEFIDLFREQIAVIVSNVDQAGDVDVFQFVADGNMVFAESFFMETDAGVWLTLSDSTGTEIFSGPHSLPGVEVAAGETYYLAVAEFDTGQTGEYRVDLFVAPDAVIVDPVDPIDPVDPDPIEPWELVDLVFGEDPHADELGEIATALRIEPGIPLSIRSFIDGAGDRDVFRFIATSPFFFATAVDDATIQVTLLDADGAEMTILDPATGEIGMLEPGAEYYLVVAANSNEYTGEYSVEILGF